MGKPDIEAYKLNKIFTAPVGDLTAEQQELMNEIKASRTTPRDARFPTQNQANHCWNRYNEWLICMKSTQDEEGCKSMRNMALQICPPFGRRSGTRSGARGLIRALRPIDSGSVWVGRWGRVGCWANLQVLIVDRALEMAVENAWLNNGPMQEVGRKMESCLSPFGQQKVEMGIGNSPAVLIAAASAAAADGIKLPANDDGAADAAAAAAAADDKSSEEGTSEEAKEGAAKIKDEAPPAPAAAWTPEEEAYAERLIQEFKAGLLPLTDGTTLRTFLSKLLNCDPMRISKKFVGSNCIGKQVFRRRGADVHNLPPGEVERTRFELSELEKQFLDRVAANGSKGSKGAGGNRRPPGPPRTRARRRWDGRCCREMLGRRRVWTRGDCWHSSRRRIRGMIDSATAQSFLNAAGASQAGSLGTLNNNSIANLVLQTGMSQDQISQLASAGISSSVSLANLLGKRNSIDRLMSLDFQSMQSIDNLANLIQAGMPNQAVPKAQMKNVDWGTATAAPANPLASLAANPAASLLANAQAAGLANAGGMKGSIESLVRTLSGNSNRAGSGGSGSGLFAANTLNLGNQANATSFWEPPPGRRRAGSDERQRQRPWQPPPEPAGGTAAEHYSCKPRQSGKPWKTQAQETLGAVGVGQNQNATSANANNLMSVLSQASQPNANPLLQQLNNPLGGNSVVAALAQQQLLAQGLGQQNQLAGLAAGINNPLGNLAGLGALGAGNNLAASGGVDNSNAAAILQQLLAQQGGSKPRRRRRPQKRRGRPPQMPEATPLLGTKRAAEGGDEGEPAAKKQQTASL
ncbi:hypothetical protein ACHAXT_006431 [Thalassiosira profunda]